MPADPHGFDYFYRTESPPYNRGSGATTGLDFFRRGEAFPSVSAAANLTATLLAEGNSTTDATSYDTASISPSADHLILLAVVSGDTVGAAAEAPSSVTGNGLTWVQVATQNNAAGNTNVTTTVFRALGAAPSVGVVTINFANTQENCQWHIAEFGNVDTSGTNGSGAIVQSQVLDDSNGSSWSMTLGSAPDDANGLYAAVGQNSSTTVITPGDGYTELGTQAGILGPTSRRFVMLDVSAPGDGVIDGTATGTASVAGVGLEIKLVGGAVTHSASATLSGTGDLSASATRTTFAAANADGAGDLAAAATRTAFASAVIDGTGDLSAVADRTTFAACELDGSGALSCSATVTPVATPTATRPDPGGLVGISHELGTARLVTIRVRHDTSWLVAQPAPIVAKGLAEWSAWAWTVVKSDAAWRLPALVHKDSEASWRLPRLVAKAAADEYRTHDPDEHELMLYLMGV